MPMFFGASTLGAREVQEDAFQVVAQSEADPNSDVLIIVADGMGGHVGGEVASNLAIERFKAHFVTGSSAPKPRDRLLDSIHAANDAVAASIQADPKLQGMGCTLVAALKLNDRLVWVSVGDSHVYLFRDNLLSHLNADHSVFGELMGLVKQGKLTQAEANAHPRRNALQSAITGQPISLIDINSTQLMHGDVIVVATDGLDTLDAPAMQSLLKNLKRSDPEVITDELLTAVGDKNRPNQDNTTIVTYRHTQAGRSELAPDSKWKMSSAWDAKSGPSLGTAARYAIATLSIVILAAIVVFLALPKSQPEPAAKSPEPAQAPATTPSRISNGQSPVDEPDPSQTLPNPEAEGTVPDGEVTPGEEQLPPEGITDPDAPTDGTTPEPTDP